MAEESQALGVSEEILRKFGRDNPNSERFEHAVACVQKLIREWGERHCIEGSMTLSMDLDDPAVVQILHDAGWEKTNG